MTRTLTAQATDSAALTGVSNALYLAMAGGETITFADASGDAASLYGTANDWDFVSGSDGTVYLSSAQATVAGGDDLIEFATGSGNVVSLTGTANNWNWVSGSDGTVAATTGAQSTVAGSGNIVIESGSGDTAFLFDTANAWDTVTGSNGTLDLASAQAFVDRRQQHDQLRGGVGPCGQPLRHRGELGHDSHRLERERFT